MTSYKIGNEIVFGLISPIGIDTNLFQNYLENVLREFNYDLEPVKTSYIIELSLEKQNATIPKNEFDRKKLLISEGDRLRQIHGADVLAKIAISNISLIRKSNTEKYIGSRRAFLINGIKHFEEIDALRSLYGPSFF